MLPHAVHTCRSSLQICSSWLQGTRPQRTGERKERGVLPSLCARPTPLTPHRLSCQIDELLEKIHSNMAACHIKNSNWKRALESAEKVSGLVTCPALPISTRCRPLQRTTRTTRPSSARARPRASLAFLKRQKRRLVNCSKTTPQVIPALAPHLRGLNTFAADAATIQAELERLRKIDQQREKVHSQKYRGMHPPCSLLVPADLNLGFLSRDKGKGVDPLERTVPIGGSKQTAHIEEVGDEPEPAPNAADSDAEDAKNVPVVRA